MNERTKHIKRIESLASTMREDLTKRQKNWAEKMLTCHAYVCKGQAWCDCCGGAWEESAKEGTVTCPHCGKKLQVKKSRSVYKNEGYFFGFTEKHEDLQVVRHFEIMSNTGRGRTPTFEVFEVCQNWIFPDGKVYNRARRIAPTYNYTYKFCHTPLKVRNDPSPYSCSPNRYKIHDRFTYKSYDLTDRLKLIGGDMWKDDVPISEWFSMLLGIPAAERYLKMGQYACVQEIYLTGKVKHERHVKIANRHGYVIEDKTLWNDMVEAMEYLGVDINHPKNLCTQDLKASHDYYVKQRRIKKQEEEDRLHAEDLAYWAMEYPKRHAMHLPIVFDNGVFFCSVLQSLQDFKDEGIEMEHCVYTNEYYKKDESVIVSITDAQGNRLETAEINVERMKVNQCQGHKNKKTEFHEAIVDLINKNIWRFAKTE